MMVVKKNQKFVAMVPLNELNELKDNNSSLTNRSRSSHIKLIRKKDQPRNNASKSRRDIKSTSRLGALES